MVSPSSEVLRWEGHDGRQEGECWMSQGHSGGPPVGHPGTPTRCVGTTGGRKSCLAFQFFSLHRNDHPDLSFPFLSFELEAACVSKSSVLSRETHSVGAVLGGSLTRRLGAFHWEKKS